MSMINEELRKQQEKDVGAAIRKVLGDDVPVIKPGDAVDTEEDRRARIDRLNEQIKALDPK